MARAETLVTMPINLADAKSAIDVIDAAFKNDPTWTWAFPDHAARRQWWTQCIHGALRYPWALHTGNFEAVSIWIPPDGTEFTPEVEQTIPALLERLVGPRAIEVSELLCRFAQSHPHDVPHYYLSLLATGDEHRGQGLGLELLKQNLARIDAEQMPAYLESSNPANNRRYEALGFTPVVCFRAPGDGPIVTGMWRDRQ